MIRPNAFRWLASGLALLAVLLTAFYAHEARGLRRQGAMVLPVAAEPSGWPPPAGIAPSSWEVLQRAGSSPAGDAGPLSGRYRLVGTYFLFGDAGSPDGERRRAVLDNMRANLQAIVGEGDQLDEFTVTRVFEDRVLLRAGDTEYELRLSFADAAAGAVQEVATAPAVSTNAPEEQAALETSRFGKRVGENRWVFRRDELMTYYREILDEPERIAALYISLQPDYQNNEVAGYRLQPEGEQEFFGAVGLKEGDVVRRVNSMRMVSQRRAEYFIGEFLKNRVSALVLDIEREGKPEKLIYLIR